MSLSPVGFVKKYLNLCVTTDPRNDLDHLEYLVWNVYVRISHYQINGSSRAVMALHVAEKPLVKKMLAEAKNWHGCIEVGKQLLFSSEVNKTIWRSFVGKGSPDDIALTLRLAVRYGLTHPAALRSYCDRYLGLDCSGFVANYANSELGMNFDVANTAANSFAPLNMRRASIDDVQPLDVLVWSQTNHVAIIDSLDQDRINFDRMKSASPNLSSLECTVAESHGHRGLGYCNYSIVSMDSTTHEFTVKRHEGHDSTWKVWIASLDRVPRSWNQGMVEGRLA
jgi:hypothetical protein